MPLKAIREDGQTIYSKQCNNSIRKEKLICPHCKEGMIFVNPYCDIIKHFRHKNTCPFSTEPESKEHIEMKAFFCNLFGGGTPEVKIGKRIADVVHDDVVIECQVSPITMKELIERTKDFNKNGYSVGWVFHPKNFMKIDGNVIKPRKVEKFIHSLFYGRVYYFVDGDVLPVHFGFEYGIGLGRRKRLWSSTAKGESHHWLDLVKSKNSEMKILLFNDGVWWKWKE